MNLSERENRVREIVVQDVSAAKAAAVEAVAMRAPYSYAELKAAQRAGGLVELLGAMDSYTLRAQALRYTLEGPVTLAADEVERRFVELVGAARFGRAA